MDLDWLLILGAQIAWMIALYTSCLFIPIALGIFAAALSGVPALAPIVNCAYYYLPLMLPSRMYANTKFYQFVHVVPLKLRIFMKYWPVQLEDWYEVTYGIVMTENSGWGVDFDCSSTFTEAAVSYLAMIAIAVLLLTVSYFLLKKRYEKA